jgi:DNA-binding CsgD family transcriptional regulator
VEEWPEEYRPTPLWPISDVLRKLGMRDRVELVRYAIRRGLVEP